MLTNPGGLSFAAIKKINFKNHPAYCEAMLT